jgi:ribosomal-protein-alanine N-acetyltransferase
MLKEIIIRPMRFDDLDRVYKLEQKSFPNPWPRAFFESDLRLKYTIAFVVEDKNEIVAYSIASCVNKKFHVANIAVDLEYQRQGIASQLMKKIEKIAIERDCLYAYLEVRTDNNAAINLYKNLGYNISGLRKYYYIDGDDAYVMDKELK